MVNCQAGGSCYGGDPSGVYDYAYYHGIPDSSCMQYVAKNLPTSTCKPIDICRDCHGPPPPPNDSGIENCIAITNYKRYYASNYYGVSGANNMKAAITDWEIAGNMNNHDVQQSAAYNLSVAYDSVRKPKQAYQYVLKAQKLGYKTAPDFIEKLKSKAATAK